MRVSRPRRPVLACSTPADSAPSIGSLRGADQRVAQGRQFWGRRALPDGDRDVFGRTAHLIYPIGEFGGFLGRQHDGIGWHRSSLDNGSLLIGPLSARLPAVLPTPAQARVGHFAATPAARLWASATRHVMRLNRSPLRAGRMEEAGNRAADDRAVSIPA